MTDIFSFIIGLLFAVVTGACVLLNRLPVNYNQKLSRKEQWNHDKREYTYLVGQLERQHKRYATDVEWHFFFKEESDRFLRNMYSSRYTEINGEIDYGREQYVKWNVNRFYHKFEHERLIAVKRRG
jgi:hypothetical protein